MPIEPCTWPALWSDCGTTEDGRPACSPLIDMTPEEVDQFVTMAGNYLSLWTGGIFGLCPVSIRPCRQECSGGSSTFWGRGPFPSSGTGGGYTPVLVQGSWYNVACGRCGDGDCGCTYVPELILPGPVAMINSIMINGETLPESAYRVDDYNRLVRLDGYDWPVCQDMAAPPDGEGAFVVDYQRGREVPVGGQIAAGVLACELAKDACGDKSCRLPRRVSSIDRQGTSIVFDDFSDLDRGQTGIWLVDSWVASVTRSPQGGTVISPDVPRRRGRVTTWIPGS